jgi:hypothetical protein
MVTVTYDEQLTAVLVIDPLTTSFPRAARYGTAFALSQKRMTAFLICFVS